jgi:hypothetical protein
MSLPSTPLHRRRRLPSATTTTAAVYGVKGAAAPYAGDHQREPWIEEPTGGEPPSAWFTPTAAVLVLQRHDRRPPDLSRRTGMKCSTDAPPPDLLLLHFNSLLIHFSFLRNCFFSYMNLADL